MELAFKYVFVDLGLPSGTKWADRNVGASGPEEYGLYFSWGNVDGHVYSDGSGFSSANYSNTTGSSLSTNIPTNKTYDAARKYCGSAWRMPTSSEWQELINYCNYSTSTLNGVSGMLLVSKNNGKSIFLPYGGYNAGSSSGSWYDYWSSTISSTSGCAYAIEWRGGSFNLPYNINRFYGFTIRPVKN